MWKSTGHANGRTVQSSVPYRRPHPRGALVPALCYMSGPISPQNQSRATAPSDSGRQCRACDLDSRGLNSPRKREARTKGRGPQRDRGAGVRPRTARGLVQLTTGVNTSHKRIRHGEHWAVHLVRSRVRGRWVSRAGNLDGLSASPERWTGLVAAGVTGALWVVRRGRLEDVRERPRPHPRGNFARGQPCFKKWNKTASLPHRVVSCPPNPKWRPWVSLRKEVASPEPTVPLHVPHALGTSRACPRVACPWSQHAPPADGHTQLPVGGGTKAALLGTRGQRGPCPEEHWAGGADGREACLRSSGPASPAGGTAGPGRTFKEAFCPTTHTSFHLGPELRAGPKRQRGEDTARTSENVTLNNVLYLRSLKGAFWSLCVSVRFPRSEPQGGLLPPPHPQWGCVSEPAGPECQAPAPGRLHSLPLPPPCELTPSPTSQVRR